MNYEAISDIMSLCILYGVEHVWGRGEVHTWFQRGNLREVDHLNDPSIDGRTIIK